MFNEILSTFFWMRLKICIINYKIIVDRIIDGIYNTSTCSGNKNLLKNFKNLINHKWIHCTSIFFYYKMVLNFLKIKTYWQNWRFLMIPSRNLAISKKYCKLLLKYPIFKKKKPKIIHYRKCRKYWPSWDIWRIIALQLLRHNLVFKIVKI